MKIAHLISTLDFSGQSINMMKVAHGQLVSGHQIKVCGEYIKDFNTSDIYPNLMLFEYEFWGEQYDLLKLDEVDIIVYWGPEKVEILDYLKTIDVKKIRVVGQIYPEAMTDKYLDVFDSFVTFTQLQADILSYLPSERTTVIGAPIEVNLIPVRPRRNPEKFIFGKLGYAGSKIYDKFPEIIKLLTHKIPNLECRIYGSEFSSHEHKWGTFEDPSLDTSSINFIQEECATPVFSQPYQYYKDFDVYIAATSTQVQGDGWSSSDKLGHPAAPIETFCTTALEAMACGIPVIVEEKGCVKEWVRHGVDGFVASTPADYAEYIWQLYNDIDLYHKMSLAARSRATDFNRDRIIEKYNKLCVEVVTQPALPALVTNDKMAIVIVYWSDDGVESKTTDDLLTYLEQTYTEDQYELFLINNGSANTKDQTTHNFEENLGFDQAVINLLKDHRSNNRRFSGYWLINTDIILEADSDYLNTFKAWMEKPTIGMVSGLVDHGNFKSGNIKDGHWFNVTDTLTQMNMDLSSVTHTGYLDLHCICISQTLVDMIDFNGLEYFFHGGFDLYLVQLCTDQGLDKLVDPAIKSKHTSTKTRPLGNETSMKAIRNHCKKLSYTISNIDTKSFYQLNAELMGRYFQYYNSNIFFYVKNMMNAETAKFFYGGWIDTYRTNLVNIESRQYFDYDVPNKLDVYNTNNPEQIWKDFGTFNISQATTADRCKYREVLTQQHPASFINFAKLFSEEQFDYVLEIGTSHGGLALFLQDQANKHGFKFLTYDNLLNDSYGTSQDVLSALNLEKLPFEQIVGDCFDTDIFTNTINIIKSNKCLVLCDGGDKPREFQEYSKYLTAGSYIMAHDYGATDDYFQQHISARNIWHWHEIKDSHIMESIKINNLIKSPIYYNDFSDVAWVCCIKENENALD